MAENLSLYDDVRAVPQNAQRTITGGRLNGKTDINPMWRIKTLTEKFGPCGFGWRYVITKQWSEQGNGGEVAAFCNIDLYVKQNGEWSEAIPGTGGSALVAKESKGLYTSDECYKMALTDAISVACKALGFGANIYWNADCTKYDAKPQQKETTTKTSKDVDPALLPGGEKFKQYVESHAKNETYKGKSMREIWANAIHATQEQLDDFDEAVFNYRVEHNQQ
jgi:hypothetical protein